MTQARKSTVLQRLGLQFIGHPRVSAPSSIFVLVVTVALCFFACMLAKTARPDYYGLVKVIGILSVSIGYLIWFVVYTLGYFMLPQTDQEFRDHAMTNEEVKFSWENGKERIAEGTANVYNETVEVLQTYKDKFKTLYVQSVAWFLINLTTVVLLGAAYSYVMSRTTGQPSVSYVNSFFDHVVSNTSVLFSVTSGGPPLSSTAKIGVLVHCFSMLILLMFGVSYLTTYEANRMTNIRNVVMSELKAIEAQDRQTRQPVASG